MHIAMELLSILADYFLRQMNLSAYKLMSDIEHEKGVKHEKALEKEKAIECYRNSLECFEKYLELYKKPPGYFEKQFCDYMKNFSSPSASDC